MTDSFNWIVPLRRVVVTREVLYRDLLWEWLRLLAPTKISRKRSPMLGEQENEEQDEDAHGKRDPAKHYEDVDINSWVIAAWYTDANDADFSPHHYAQGIAELRHWWHDSFEGTLPTSNSGTTTKDIPEFNFHARLWKGPKRVLAELNAKDDEETLEQLRPYTWEGGKVGLEPDETHRAKEIKLLPGDVLELPLHVFLHACGQQRFQGVDFNPKGSFFLGTSVHKPGEADVPRLHDNMLAMRYQLLHSLAMANCYHHEPVFTSSFKPNALVVKPEGAGVYARGMPYGGNLGTKTFDNRWEVTSVAEIHRDLPTYLPPYQSLLHLADTLPLTWTWVCSPFAMFWLHYMAVSHRTASGVLLDSKVRGGSMASAVMTVMKKGANPETHPNATQLKHIHELQGRHDGDPLLLHNLTEGDVTLPREQPPVADLCEFVFPAGGSMPLFRTFSQPSLLHTVPEPPDKGHDVPIHKLCPDAGVLVVSAASGHEFAMVRLNYPDRLRERAIDDLVALKSLDEIHMPIAGELSGYCPMSGVDRFTQASTVQKGKRKNKGGEDGADGADGAGDAVSRRRRDVGQYFIDESSAKLPPKDRHLYKPLQLQEMMTHVFKPVTGNVLFFKRDKDGLKVAEGGRSTLRSKAVSTIIFIRHGGNRDPNPRALTNVYASVSHWYPLTLKLPHGGPKEIKDLLANWETLYAERAVPFPAMQEIAAAFPSRGRVLQQLINHREKIKETVSNSARWRAEGDALVDKIEDLKNQKKAEKGKGKGKGKGRVQEIDAKLKVEVAKLNKIRPEYNLCTNPVLVKELLDRLPPDPE